MRITSCPDCGEVVEIPPPTGEDDDQEVTCQVCGLSAPASEWQAYAPEDDESLLGRPLAAATMPDSMPKSWVLRVEQLEEIREVVTELAYQIRLLRHALDELNQDLPEILQRRLAALGPESASATLRPPAAARPQPVAAAAPTPPPVCSSAEPLQQAGAATTRGPQTKRKASASRTNQSGLW
jgi:hypothetical protein